MVMPGVGVHHQQSSLPVRIIKMIPLMLLVLIAYFAVALFAGDPTDDIKDPLLKVLTDPWFSVGLPSGGVWSFTLEHVFIGISLIFLFFELVKATGIGGEAIAEMAVSTVVFILFLVLFMTIKSAATSLFFILTMISFIDVLAGYIIGIKVARRDFSVG